MSYKQKSIVWTVLLVAVVLLGALAFAAGRPRRLVDPAGKKETIPSGESHAVQSRSAKAGGPGSRNLSLQPEAFNMARRLGQRFSPGKRERSIMVGTLTMGSEQRIVQTTRTQTDDGEQVEIKIAGSSDGPVQLVRFALYDAGILPSEARVTSGRVGISITDFTGGSEGLVVQREEGRQAVGQVRRDGPRWRGHQEMNLSPGTYYVYDASRSQNRATLIVEP